MCTVLTGFLPATPSTTSYMAISKVEMARLPSLRRPRVTSSKSPALTASCRGMATVRFADGVSSSLKLNSEVGGSLGLRDSGTISQSVATAFT